MFLGLPYRAQVSGPKLKYPNGYVGVIQKTASAASLGLSENLVNVVLPMFFQHEDLKSVSNDGLVVFEDGRDIRLETTADGLLKFEQEYYNPQSGEWVGWVNLPTLSLTTLTTVFLYYGNENAASSPANEVDCWAGHYGSFELASGVDHSGSSQSLLMTGVSATQLAGLLAGGFSPDNATSDAIITDTGDVLVTSFGSAFSVGDEVTDGFVTDTGDLLVTSSGDAIAAG